MFRETKKRISKTNNFEFGYISDSLPTVPHKNSNKQIKSLKCVQQYWYKIQLNVEKYEINLNWVIKLFIVFIKKNCRSDESWPVIVFILVIWKPFSSPYKIFLERDIDWNYIII